MTPSGFQITRLALTGTGVPDATVSFGPGLSVISGPSDTGKTFIGECIDYALGASRRPSSIPEAQLYECVVLGVKPLSTGVQYSIKRSLRGGDALLSAPGQPDRTLAAKHRPGKDDTISHFLLSLCGLDGRIVRTNSQGATRQISFRDVAKLMVVAEQEIIRKHSPVRSGQNTEKTVEDSVFRLLLTGVDDASVVAVPDRATVAAESRGKAEVLDLLIGKVRASLEVIAPGEAQAELSERLRAVDASIDAALAVVASEQQAASSIEERRAAVWAQLRANQSRQAVLSELRKRFALLKAQYASDLRRLESIAETGARLDQMDQKRCPVCGSEAKHHTRSLPDHAIDLTTVAQACSAEASRLQPLLSDLDETIAQNDQAMSRLTQDTDTQVHDLRAAEGQLASYFKPRLNDALNRLQKARELQARVRQALDLHARMEALNALRVQHECSGAPVPKAKFAAAPGSRETEELALKVEELLRAWQFPGLQRVTFSDADQDILVSGRKRSDHGKGVRAITHAAFTVALMYYCLDKHMPHPGVVVIDSPLVVYREPDQDEAGFSRALKDLTYLFLASQQGRGQVILLENEDPPDAMPGSPAIVRFTGAAHGRTGFIPSPTQTQSAVPH